MRGTPDYYNRCYSFPTGPPPYYFNVPNNNQAFQEAYQGNAYAGIHTTTYSNIYEYREYLQSKLQRKLQRNKKYCVGMYTNLGYDSKYRFVDVVALKDMGIFFI